MLSPFVPILHEQLCRSYNCGIDNLSANHANRGRNKVPGYYAKTIPHHIIDKTSGEENGPNIKRQHQKMPQADARQRQFRFRLGEIRSDETVVEFAGALPKEDRPYSVAYALACFCFCSMKQVQQIFRSSTEMPLPRQRPPPLQGQTARYRDIHRIQHQRLGFEPFLGNSLTLYRPLKDIRMMAGKD